MPSPGAACRDTGMAAIVTSAWLRMCVWEHLLKVHAVKLIARENQHVLDARLLEIAEILPHRVRRALVPLGLAIHRLLRRQDLEQTRR